MRVVDQHQNAFVLETYMIDIKEHCKAQLKASTCGYCQYDGNCSGKKGIHATIGRLEKYVQSD